MQWKKKKKKKKQTLHHIIALRVSYSTKIGLPITTHHYPLEDKN